MNLNISSSLVLLLSSILNETIRTFGVYHRHKTRTKAAVKKLFKCQEDDMDSCWKNLREVRAPQLQQQFCCWCSDSSYEPLLRSHSVKRLMLCLRFWSVSSLSHFASCLCECQVCSCCNCCSSSCFFPFLKCPLSSQSDCPFHLRSGNRPTGRHTVWGLLLWFFVVWILSVIESFFSVHHCMGLRLAGICRLWNW